MSKLSQDGSQLPSPEDFFLTLPLYKKFKLLETDGQYVDRLEKYYGSFLSYCVECEKDTVFSHTLPAPGNGPRPEPAFDPTKGYGRGIIDNHTFNDIEKVARQQNLDARLRDRIFQVRLVCQLNRTHYMYFIFQISDLNLKKIGQTPSVADLEEVNLKKYRKILGNRYADFSRAVGLNAHGVGAGALVYLRRIFESMVEEVHQEEAKSNASWDEGTYQRSRWDERIEMLAPKLPEFLVESKRMYSVLSKGIHELSEEDCLSFFPLLKTGIELILDEKIEKAEKETKITATRKSIQALKP